MMRLIRLARLEDIASLIKLDTVAAHDVERIEQIQYWVQSQSCYVLIEQNVIMAYAVLHHHFFAQAFIEMLMVDQSYRQQGLGLALIQHLQVISSTKLFSSTNASNTKMQRLFEKAGFKRSGYIDHLDHDDPELIYVYLGSVS